MLRLRRAWARTLIYNASIAFVALLSKRSYDKVLAERCCDWCADAYNDIGCKTDCLAKCIFLRHKLLRFRLRTRLIPSKAS